VLFATSATKDFLAAYVDRDQIVVEDVLGELLKRSLVKTEVRNADVCLYKVHDLTFSFVRVLAIERKLRDDRLVAAAERYMLAHGQDFELLHADQPHILGAAGSASDQSLVRIVAPLAMGGYPNAKQFSYMDVHGHSSELVARLDQAIAACRRTGAEYHEVLHYLLSKRANAHVDRGEAEEAMAKYQQALELAPNPTRQVVLLAVMGRENARQGRKDQAKELFEQARQIATTHDDYNGRMRALEQESWAASFDNDYVEVRKLAKEGIEISKQCGDPIREGYFKINYGSAELELLSDTEAENRQIDIDLVLDYHCQALEIAQREHDETLRAHALFALGQDYETFRNRETAITYLRQAHELFKELGHTRLAKEVEAFIQQAG
jgi:tetratricopeptide (TPR) repeat protein